MFYEYDIDKKSRWYEFILQIGGQFMLSSKFGFFVDIGLELQLYRETKTGESSYYNYLSEPVYEKSKESQFKTSSARLGAVFYS